jgi:glycosyltransferase involved in cell wall biosynthesis
MFVNPYQAVFMSDSHVINEEINCMDVLLHPSQTEGFGLTIVEAQSAGVPAIINNCHSMPELILEGKTGFSSKTSNPRWTNDGSYTYPADVNSLYEQMEKAYLLVKENPNKVKNDCRKHIKRNFDIDVLYETKWKGFLEKLQSEILGDIMDKNVKIDSLR